MKKVTFVVCNYNYSEYIESALNSIFNQTYDKINCCIIDDNSTDDSVEKIETLLAKEKEVGGVYSGIPYSGFTKNSIEIILLKLDNNIGPAGARNLGIQYFWDETDVFSILDMDDMVEPNKIEKLVPYFEDNSIGVVYADYITFDEETGNQTRVFKESFSRERLMEECIVHSGSLISKEALEYVRDENGFYDNSLRVCEDFDLWLRISGRYLIMHHPEFLTNVRVTPKNSTNSVDTKIWKKNYKQVIEKLKIRNNL